MNRREALLAALAAFPMAPAIAQAQAYPDRPVKMINPFPPGTAIEAVARILQKQIQTLWTQPLVIESKPGAGGMNGTNIVAHSPADGYTLLVTSHSPITIAPVLNEKALQYSPTDDLVPLWGLGSSGTLIAVTPSFPAKTLAELVEYCKKHPGAVSYATSGVGSTMHLAGEQFRALTGAPMLHVPYRGSAPAATAVMGGEVPVLVDGAVNLVTHIKAGRLRPLVLIGENRLAALPDVPTGNELGLQGLASRSFFAFYAPRKNLPPEILQKLRADIAKAMSTPDAQKMLASAGLDAPTFTGPELEQRIRADLEGTRRIVKTANIAVE